MTNKCCFVLLRLQFAFHQLQRQRHTWLYVKLAKLCIPAICTPRRNHLLVVTSTTYQWFLASANRLQKCLLTVPSSNALSEQAGILAPTERIVVLLSVPMVFLETKLIWPRCEMIIKITRINSLQKRLEP